MDGGQGILGRGRQQGWEWAPGEQGASMGTQLPAAKRQVERREGSRAGEIRTVSF